MKILKEYDLSNKDLDELTRAIQSIQQDVTSVREYNKQRWITQWLDKNGLKRSEAINEIINERKNEMI